jgi:thioredoxin reductase
VVYQCLNAPYIAWPELFPPLQRGVPAAAEHADALLVTLENVYGYGPTGVRAMTEDLLRCPYCHGWEVRDQPLGVIGALPGSAQHALLVRQWSEDIVFFVHPYDLTSSEQHQLKARGIEVIVGEVAQLVVEDDHLTGVAVADGRVVARTALFVRSGNHSHDDGLPAGPSCELEDGFPLVGSAGLTSVPGVWAAGNVADPRDQVDA